MTCDPDPDIWSLTTVIVIVRLLLTLFSWSGPVQVSSVISAPCHHWVTLTPMSGTRLSEWWSGLGSRIRGGWGWSLSLSNHPWRSPTYSALSCEVSDIPCVTQCHPRASHPPIETGAKLWICMYPWPWWSIDCLCVPYPSPWSDPFLPQVLRTLVAPLVCVSFHPNVMSRVTLLISSTPSPLYRESRIWIHYRSTHFLSISIPRYDLNCIQGH